MLKELKEYIETWNAADNPKPCNEDIFVKEFLEIINNLEDERDISFDGDNAYGGKQITLRLNSFWYHDKDQVAWFEIAYSPDYVKVYTAKHHGFRYRSILEWTMIILDSKKCKVLCINYYIKCLTTSSCLFQLIN